MSISGDDVDDDNTLSDDESTTNIVTDTTDHGLLLSNTTTLVDSDSHIIADKQLCQGTLFGSNDNNSNKKKKSKKGNSTVRSRNRWPKMKEIVKDEDGYDQTVYPFLEADNWMDTYFVQHMAAEYHQ
jgi:hypothetical protein